MHLPALMPQELQFLSAVTDEQQLVDILLTRPLEQIILGLETFADDETWCESHPQVLPALLDHLTQCFLSRQMSQPMLDRISEAIHLHFRVLRDAIPSDLKIDVRGHQYVGNRLLFAQASEYFKESILAKSSATQRVTQLELGSASTTFLDGIVAYVRSGRADHLQTASKEALLEELLLAAEWRMPGLRALCVRALQRYLDTQAAIKLLTTPPYHRLDDVRRLCCDYWNRQVTGFHVETQTDGELALVIQRFHASERPLLEMLAPLATRLALRGTAATDPIAIEVLKRSTQITALDLSETIACSPGLIDVAPAIIDLRLAGCGWVDAPILLDLIERFTTLRKLDLSGETHLPAALWRRLKDYDQLESLLLSHCHQLTDEDIAMITGLIGSALQRLDVSWCLALTDQGTHAILRTCPQLTQLILSHCSQTGDQSVNELAGSATLRHIGLAGCTGISDEPVRRLALQAPALMLLDLRYCRLSAGLITDIRRRRPQLTLLVD